MVEETADSEIKVGRVHEGGKWGGDILGAYERKSLCL